MIPIIAFSTWVIESQRYAYVIDKSILITDS